MSCVGVAYFRAAVFKFKEVSNFAEMRLSDGDKI